ncbi:hypothetical protein CHLNCDRAFT_133394 [Chlorella variabilis]|uniref:Uncharacterized protein n=1 Tax=Chlorella variabilis TaxID=554065 RepID=E1Z305_CHLVA|nr:hypothetical protein CHLNCDRAFT_133394 [Chlorella variabilis]EFN60085.1 hypothetical protein CHLNCDRAFT_133394 [Chlorella variabilis]|eukprot:XP_005852187.1 hypothetical protein CHLNCDRAFT_133394 [Chlorella variabilis]
MTQDAASRIQSAEARAHDGNSAADKAANVAKATGPEGDCDSERHESPWIARASSGGGGGSGSGGSPGSGGGGGDDGGEPEPAPQTAAFGWKGWQDRVAADPQFVTSCIPVPALTATPPPAPPPPRPAAGHMFQPGFSLASRAVNFAYKGAVFAVIGLGAGLLGTATSNGLLALRKRLDPSFKPRNEAPSIVGNASCWAVHMGVSANTRYQLINGLDMVLQPIMPSPLFRLYSSVIRGGNNLAGGVSFVLLAKLLGVQKAAEAAPLPEPVGKGKKTKK